MRALLRLLFLPEFGRALRDVRRSAARLGALAGALAPAPKTEWRNPLARGLRGRALSGAAIVLLGTALLAFAAAAAGAQTPAVFAEEDAGTRRLLSFLADLRRGSALGGMLFAFNAAVLVLAGFLLIWHVVAGTVDTAREGRLGLGGREILRIVLAVALMTPLPGGMNGGQHVVVGLAHLGGDFATAVWTPFSADALRGGKPVAPRPRAAAWRAAVSRALIAEVCLRVANASASSRRVVVRADDEKTARVVRYDGDRRGLPGNMCGAVRYAGVHARKPGVDRSSAFGFDMLDQDGYAPAEGPRGDAARAHLAALEGLRTTVLRERAARLGDRFVPGSPVYGRPLPDLDAFLEGIADGYARVLDARLRQAAGDERDALERAVAEDAGRRGWLAAAAFFNTLARRTGRFQAAAYGIPDVALPSGSLEGASPPAAAAVQALTVALAQTRNWKPVVFGGGALPSSGGDGGVGRGFFDWLSIDDAVVPDTGNPVADLAGYGHEILGNALAALSALAAAATVSGGFQAVPLLGRGLDLFGHGWQVADFFVSTILSILLVAGAVLAYVLPAIPFVRFLFGTVAWIVDVAAAVFAVTVFLAAHVSRGDGFVLPATRQGWLFLPGLILRPPLMLLGLVAGYFVFLAAMGLFNEVWKPQLRDANASDGLGIVGYLAYLAIYVMTAWALLNASFKLIDGLPAAAMEWIGGRVREDGGADRLLGAVTGGVGRLGGLRVGSLRRAGAGPRN